MSFIPFNDSNLVTISILQLNLDGTVEVMHPEGTIKTYPLDQLTRLYDGIDQLEEDIYDQEGNEQAPFGEEVWAMEDGVWRPTTLDSEDGWVDDEDEEESTGMIVADTDHATDGDDAVDLDAMDIDITGWGEANGPGPSPPIISPSSPSQSSFWSELAEEAAVTNNLPTNGTENATHMVYTPTSTSPSSPMRNTILPPTQNRSTSTTPMINMEISPAVSGASSLSKEYVFKDKLENNVNGIVDAGNATGLHTTKEIAKSEPTEELTWKRFDILPCAPPDHAFYSSPPAQPAKSFLNRLNREYRALASSLPGVSFSLVLSLWRRF